MTYGLGPFDRKQIKLAFKQAHKGAAMNSINDRIDGDDIIHRFHNELRLRSDYRKIPGFPPNKKVAPPKAKDQKMRRPFTLRDSEGAILAKGIVYEQGNIQVLWRIDIGWTGEQYNMLANVLGIVPNVKIFCWED